MKRAVSYRVVTLMLCAGFPAASSPALAQGRLALTLAAGPSPYDLSGTGTGTAGGAFLAWRPVHGLIVEPGIGVFGYTSQFDESTVLLFPEVSVQGELTLGSFRPFLGGGAGWSLGVSGFREQVATLHAVGGARVDLGSDWGLLGELRIRAVRPWTGNTADFLFGVSRSLQAMRAGTVPPAIPVAPTFVRPSRFELAGHLGVHVDRSAEVDREVTDGFTAMRAGKGEASALSGRLGYWLQPRLGLQLDVSRSSNRSWQGSTSFPVPEFANRTTYLSTRVAVRTDPSRKAQLFAAAGPALMLYGGTGENLRTRDSDIGGALELGARLRITPAVSAELALGNYFYRSRYRDEGNVFRHDFLILPGLVVSWP
jgi:hypothetical protein